MRASASIGIRKSTEAASAQDDARARDIMLLRYALLLSLIAHFALICMLQPVLRGAATRSMLDRSIAATLSVSFLHRSPAPVRRDERRLNEPSRPPSGRYLAASAVQVPARPIKLQPIIIPERAYLDRTKGKVRLRIFIDRRGSVAHVEIVAAEPPGVYERSAIEAVTASIFAPARLNGIPIATVKDIEIDVDPYDTIGMP